MFPPNFNSNYNGFNFNGFNKPQVNPEQFKNFINNLKPSALDELEKIARQRGISENEISQGKEFVLSLMK